MIHSSLIYGYFIEFFDEKDGKFTLLYHLNSSYFSFALFFCIFHKKARKLAFRYRK